MTHVQKMLAAVAICALFAARAAVAQSTFVSDLTPANFEDPSGDTDGELVQPRRVAAPARTTAQYGGTGYQQGGAQYGGDCDSCNGGCNGDSCGYGDGSCGHRGGCCGLGCCLAEGCGDCCGQNCSHRRAHGGWYAGGEAVWVKPYFQNNRAFVAEITSSTGTTLFDNVFAISAFEYDYEVSPRAWVGYENACGFGVRGRWWQLDHESNGLTFEDTGDGSATVTIPDLDALGIPGFTSSFTTDVGDVLTLSHAFKLDVVDLEFTQRFNLCKTELVGAVGARYARVQHEFLSEVVDDNIVTIGALGRLQDFEGAGLTLALDARRPCSCHWALVGGARYSIIFGQRDVATASLTQPDGPLAVGFISSEDEVLGIAELQGGVEWSHCLACGARLYSQALVEGQYWQGSGNATATDADMGLLGFGVTAGIVR